LSTTSEGDGTQLRHQPTSPRAVRIRRPSPKVSISIGPPAIVSSMDHGCTRRFIRSTHALHRSVRADVDGSEAEEHTHTPRVCYIGRVVTPKRPIRSPSPSHHSHSREDYARVRGPTRQSDSLPIPTKLDVDYRLHWTRGTADVRGVADA
jgi:hypothetical protein